MKVSKNVELVNKSLTNLIIKPFVTRLENESQFSSKKPKNFHHERVRSGMFAGTLGHWKAKMCSNSLTQTLHNLAHQCYLKKIVFLYSIWTQYLIELCLNCNLNYIKYCQCHTIFENIS